MFIDIKSAVQKRFGELVANGPLFHIEVDRDKIWDIYLNAFEHNYKQENTCNCCKSFLRQYAGIVGIKDNKIISIWDFECEDPEYKYPIKAVRDYVLSLPISNVLMNPFSKCGTDKNFDKVRNVEWQHFFVELPKYCVKKEDSIAPKQGEARDNKNVLKRSLDEITDSAVATVLELISQGTLYRGKEYESNLKSFDALKKVYKSVPNQLRDNFCWSASLTVNTAVCRMRNTALGTFLTDLSEGKDLDNALAAYERVVAPSNYKRPTAAVTPAMLETAQKRLIEMGLQGSLERRILDSRDLAVSNALFVYRPTPSVSDVFSELKSESLVNPRSLSKVEEISINDFIDKVLPTCKSVRALVENSHMPNFVTLVGPKNSADPTMFKWDNNFSWAYTGDVADSIKERVKAAGGNVSGFIRVSLSWHNYDDLDLSVQEPNYYNICYMNKKRVSPSGGMLDVDMNAGHGSTRTPVENICWVDRPKLEGVYSVVVTNFCRRDNKDGGFEVEIECDGEVQNFSSSTNAATGKKFEIAKFKYTNKDGFSILDSVGKSSIAKYNSREKWGVKTGQFVTVRAITLSPNYWSTTQVGNKHFMFLLEGCKSDEKTRPFFNEFLKTSLDPDRKVFEILGSKIKIDKAEDELSGLGFSDTLRNHLFVEVEGSFKRILKVTF